jgi:predicted RND superfamily exporter protein
MSAYLYFASLISLESVCFAILIGISCDFVLHFGHAYCSQPAHTCREVRTKKALILMGPSILAAAITTIAAAVVMKFARIVFFQKFATILLYALVMALFGSMTVFLVLTDVFGPADPTAFADYLTGAVLGKQKSVQGAHISKQVLDPSPTQTYRGKLIGHDESYA